MCNRTASEIFYGSNGDETRAYYACLSALGPHGELCVCLLRSQKCSERAKKYRGGIPGKGRYRDLAYARKNWSMGLLCDLLETTKEVRWGWKLDLEAAYHKWCLYLELPGCGQVSFHAEIRGKGPDYPGDWDKMHLSRERILYFCDAVHVSAAMEKLNNGSDRTSVILQP